VWVEMAARMEESSDLLWRLREEREDAYFVSLRREMRREMDLSML